MLKKKVTFAISFSLFLLSSAFAPCTFAASVETVGDLTVDGLIWSTSGGFKFPDGTTLTTSGLSGLLFNIGFVVDNSNSNTGNLNSGAIKFGTGATGEGIASQRTSGTGQNGLDFYTNSTSRLFIGNNGYVGIGTRTPNFPLTVANTAADGYSNARFGSDRPVYLLDKGWLGLNMYFNGAWTYGTTGYGGAIGGVGETGNMYFYLAPSATAGATTTSTAIVKMTLTNAGNLGIGTYSPSQKLDVAGNINASGNVTAGNITASGALGGASINASGNVTGGNITASGALTGHDGYFTSSLNLDQGNTNNGGLSGAVLTFGNGSGEGIASKRTATGNQFGLDFYTGFNNRMSITNGGDVNVTGNVTVKGMMNIGSGTGTTEAPSNSIIVRKTNSLNNTAGNKVAVTDWLALVRNGSNGGFSISNTSTGWSGVVSCMGMNSSNVSVNKYLEVGPGPVTTALFSDADGVVYFQCNFGDPYGNGRITHVSLFRKTGDYMWLGTIISDVNQ